MCANVNKRFLSSLISGVRSHNKREEEEECWRARRVEDQNNLKRRRTEGRGEHVAVEGPRETGAAGEELELQRAQWAERKALAMAEQAAIVLTAKNGVEEEEEEEAHERSKHRKHKRHKKKKKQKKKEKKHHSRR
jgi:hypothetical protein